MSSTFKKIKSFFSGTGKKTNCSTSEKKTPQDETLNLNHVYTTNELKEMPVTDDLEDNLQRINIILSHNIDFVLRRFKIGQDQSLAAALIYLDGMVNVKALDDDIMKPLLEACLQGLSGVELVRRLNNGSLIARTELYTAQYFYPVVASILTGGVALFINGQPHTFIYSCKGYKGRSIPEPVYENGLRGPREAFVESLTDNITLLRKRLATPNLMMENINIGQISNTTVVITYIKGLAAESLVKEVRQRLSRINTDAILDSGYLEQYLQDSPYTPFPLIGSTERPDRVAGDLLEGRVAILTDNTPFALLAPGDLFSFLQTPEDYFSNYYFSTFVRLVRFFSFLLTLILPALYIAITTFHQEMIPTTLFISIAAARQGVPFPAVVEAFTMVFLFEVIREASLRLPFNISNTVSIVGGLIIGQAAVQANIVSPLMIIIMAITAITSFTIPQYSLGRTIRLLIFPIMLASSILGLFGIMLCLLALLLHLCSLRSFGLPYLSPLTPLKLEGLKDSLILAPHWSRTKRPWELVKDNVQRQEANLRPGPQKKS